MNNKTAKGWRKRRVAYTVDELSGTTLSTVTVDEYNDTTKQDFIKCPICYDQPQEWVGLTEEEIESEADEATDYYTFKAAVRWAEQRLKERNT